jgi:transglutaminase-like putative cysteine protease
VDSGYHEHMWKANDVLKSGHGLCFGKTHLLVALCRSLGIPAGLCYQRIKSGDHTWFLHGLAAVYLEQLGRWIRLDPRGNISGIIAEFSVDEDKIAYYPHTDGEWLDQHIYPEPWQDLIRIVEMSADVDQLIVRSQEIRNPPMRHDRSLPDESLICST